MVRRARMAEWAAHDRVYPCGRLRVCIGVRESRGNTRGSPTRSRMSNLQANAASCQAEGNIFDNLPSFRAPNDAELSDELERYLSTDVEDVQDPLQWWTDRKSQFPNLSRMAIDFLTLPGEPCAFLHAALDTHTSHVLTATAVAVEHTFSLGRLLLPYVRNRMRGQTTRALLCLRSWSEARFVKQMDAKKVAQMDDLEGDETDFEMEEGWDCIDDDDAEW